MPPPTVLHTAILGPNPMVTVPRGKFVRPVLRDVIAHLRAVSRQRYAALNESDGDMQTEGLELLIAMPMHPLLKCTYCGPCTSKASTLPMPPRRKQHTGNPCFSLLWLFLTKGTVQTPKRTSGRARIRAPSTVAAPAAPPAESPAPATGQDLPVEPMPAGNDDALVMSLGEYHLHVGKILKQYIHKENTQREVEYDTLHKQPRTARIPLSRPVLVYGCCTFFAAPKPASSSARAGQRQNPHDRLVESCLCEGPAYERGVEERMGAEAGKAGVRHAEHTALGLMGRTMSRALRTCLATRTQAQLAGRIRSFYGYRRMSADFSQARRGSAYKAVERSEYL
ncbi:hypothetical protein B0H10DRAFT_1959609 [Mycena sp. CBHHK59/15]|nr:hypothetical protein B0H10DRAFT_1959609 [Mycena sp. CBHHK59/15]